MPEFYLTPKPLPNALLPDLACRPRYNARLLDSRVMLMMRPSGRSPDALRDVVLTRNYTCHAEGSVLVEFGATRVLCTASVEDGVPRFLRGKGQGWITAEYGMLPRATGRRTQREAARGRQGGRTQEIQRLIGRALRAGVDLGGLGDYTIYIDCDVLQADGGTRTAAITGSSVALADALGGLVAGGKLSTDPYRRRIAAVSVGIFQGEPVLDLDYAEDSAADTDLNVVMAEGEGIIEIQGTAEGAAFSRDELGAMLGLAEKGIAELFEFQAAALNA